jgi:hypothetical protein
MAVALLKDSIGKPIYRPHLTSVRMPRNMEVGTQLNALLDRGWLVVENYDISITRSKLQERLTLTSHHIITTHNRYLANAGNAVTKKPYIRFLDKALSTLYSADILVVTRNHKYAIRG